MTISSDKIDDDPHHFDFDLDRGIREQVVEKLEPLIGSLKNLELSGIDWAIVGGESGYGARPIQEDWVIEIRNQCQKAGVAFFFKQWGGVNKKKTGRLLEGRTWNEMPEEKAQAIAV